MGTTELSNVKPPVSGRVVSISVGGRDVGPGEGLIEFSVPRHIAEKTTLGGTWILSRVAIPDTPKGDGQ